MCTQFLIVQSIVAKPVTIKPIGSLAVGDSDDAMVPIYAKNTVTHGSGVCGSTGSSDCVGGHVVLACFSQISLLVPLSLQQKSATNAPARFPIGSLVTEEMVVVEMFLMIFGFAMSLLFNLFNLLCCLPSLGEEAVDLVEKKRRSDFVRQITSLAST